MLELTTPRLVLRTIQESDFDAIHAYASDSEVTRYTLFGPNSEQDTRDFIAQARAAAEAEPRLRTELAIIVRDTDRLVGVCSVGLENPTRTEASLGYTLSRDAWGHGYVTEAIHALVEYAFQQAGMHRVFAVCHPDNHASARVMEKLGMRYEGRMREVKRVRGEWWDFMVYAVLEHEFR